MRNTSTLVLGVGNILLSDEGAGVHAMQYLQQHQAMAPPAEFQSVRFLDGGTLSFTLAADIEWAGCLIVFDAAQLNAAAGHVRSFVGEDMDRFLSFGQRSVHEVGLADLMDIARLTGHLPQNRALIGIQPELLGWGEQPADAVMAALPVAAEMALALMRTWLPPQKPDRVKQSRLRKANVRVAPL
jgi:hydrogenase maturation protease